LQLENQTTFLFVSRDELMLAEIRSSFDVNVIAEATQTIKPQSDSFPSLPIFDSQLIRLPTTMSTISSSAPSSASSSRQVIITPALVTVAPSTAKSHISSRGVEFSDDDDDDDSADCESESGSHTRSQSSAAKSFDAEMLAIFSTRSSTFDFLSPAKPQSSSSFPALGADKLIPQSSSQPLKALKSLPVPEKSKKPEKSAQQSSFTSSATIKPPKLSQVESSKSTKLSTDSSLLVDAKRKQPFEPASESAEALKKPKSAAKGQLR
jgi:hypothetical protein